MGEELISGLKRYGRLNIQSFVARSRDISDTVSYLQAEAALEIVKATSFVTTDLIKFERREIFFSNPDQEMG